MQNKIFGTLANGDDVYLIELFSKDLCVKILTLGAILQEMKFKDKPVVLGYTELEPYTDNKFYYGAVIGRFANRLKNGQAKLLQGTIQAEINTDTGHHIHGGSKGSCNKNWRILEQSKSYVVLEVLLPDGEMGFPGNLTTQVRYELLPNASLKINISARTDAQTLCSFTHHNYFNLNGEGTICGHSLQIEADNYIDTDPHGIPVEICKVNKSQFDFKKKRVISTKDIIDHNFCISNSRTKMKKVAQLTHGLLSMELMSTEPGLQVYTGHKIGIALEPQLWPDAPNNELYPSAFLEPDEVYEQETIFHFFYKNS
ncbi:galactose mutarotase [Amylibacter sp.]|nr:galactose mutarotase [Amylibacter sp.]